MDLAGWLRSLGLERYEAAFRDNAIDDTVLPNLTAEDLKELGVSLVGHRRKLLDAIASLRIDTRITPPVASKGIDKDIAERRHITVMFSDLVGSTALSGSMDPEDLREVISAYQKCAGETIRRFGGLVARYMGDGVLVYFGYPEAHEDDAERAVKAGLDLVAAVVGLKTRAALQARVGIATGLVVVGDLIGSRKVQDIVGVTPNLAARLQAIAEPNAVVIADSTRKLVGNLFEFKDLGYNNLKGIEGATRAWAALRANSVESRFEALHTSRLTPLVGREEESELLLRRWSRAKAAEGQVVLLSGEAGIGKSRLAATLIERLAIEPHALLRYFCSPQHMDSALYPIIGQMERAAGLAHDDCPKTKLDKLDALLAQTSTSSEDAALLAEMILLSNDGRYPALDLTPQHRRQRTLAALISQIEALAGFGPVLMIFEDVHWVDPTCLEVIGRVVDRIATLRVLLIVSFRPEFEPPWIGRPHVTPLTINRLAQRDIDVLVDRVVGNKLLPTSIREDIIERTDGIPLFIEEMTQAVLEAEGEGGARWTAAAVPSPAKAIPVTLHASLLARLDRLGRAKGVAQIGAAIGREFSHSLIVSVAWEAEAELQRALDRLIGAGLLFRRGVPPHATYLFKHVLVQEAAYATLLRADRQMLHARIASVLEKDGSAAPEDMAHHLAQAGQLELAVPFWLTSGRRDAQCSANIEAIAHLNRGIAALQSLPVTPECMRRELEFQLALGPALLGIWNVSDAERAYGRALAICDVLDEQRDRFDVVWGLWITSFQVRRDSTVEHVAELFRIAERLDDEALRLQAHHAAWPTNAMQGELVEARDHVRQGLGIYDPVKHRGHALCYAGHDPGVCGYSLGASYLWLLGYPQQAEQSADSGLALAESLRHGPSLAFTLCYGRGVVDVMRGDSDRALRVSERLVGVAIEHGLSVYLTIARAIRAWALAKQGRQEEGISELQRELAAIDAGPVKVCRTLFKGMLIAVHCDWRESNAGIAAAEDALRAIEADREVFWQSEILRLRGELHWICGDHTAAEADFVNALNVARQQSARSLELRASASMARLWRDQGKLDEARALLAPVYTWFTEGFDSRDLNEARTLLGTLRS
jgi:class 3 adenylate cyclase/tetratricopeptide (TPR) repeat protein